MRKVLSALACATALTLVSGCAYMPGGTDLSDVAATSGLQNVTTGDGTFADYTATGHYSGTEIGIAVGLPFLLKFMELYPAQTNEALLSAVAKTAAEDGADAMINVTPHTEFYTGFPFFIVGLYIDTADGTGIDLK